MAMILSIDFKKSNRKNKVIQEFKKLFSSNKDFASKILNYAILRNTELFYTLFNSLEKDQESYTDSIRKELPNRRAMFLILRCTFEKANGKNKVIQEFNKLVNSNKDFAYQILNYSSYRNIYLFDTLFDSLSKENKESYMKVISRPARLRLNDFIKDSIFNKNNSDPSNEFIISQGISETYNRVTTNQKFAELYSLASRNKITGFKNYFYKYLKSREKKEYRDDVKKSTHGTAMAMILSIDLKESEGKNKVTQEFNRLFSSNKVFAYRILNFAIHNNMKLFNTLFDSLEKDQESYMNYVKKEGKNSRGMFSILSRTLKEAGGRNKVIQEFKELLSSNKNFAYQILNHATHNIKLFKTLFDSLSNEDKERYVKRGISQSARVRLNKLGSISTSNNSKSYGHIQPIEIPDEWDPKIFGDNSTTHGQINNVQLQENNDVLDVGTETIDKAVIEKLGDQYIDIAKRHIRTLIWEHFKECSDKLDEDSTNSRENVTKSKEYAASMALSLRKELAKRFDNALLKSSHDDLPHEARGNVLSNLEEISVEQPLAKRAMVS
ncbi:hypothetical protein [Wolbachia endosymbiont of Pentidionis agamae]|uniref:hypothetical protein n=1 Tax=Wolbachia endosymbiont of Pentidionis agamae TaxID=3110435 RepID=UPI002FCF7678